VLASPSYPGFLPLKKDTPIPIDPAVKSTLSTKSFAVPSPCKQSEIGATTRILLVTDEPAAAVERATAAGAAEVYPVGEQHGWLLGRIEDPYGHHWEIGKPLVPWPPPGGRPVGHAP